MNGGELQTIQPRERFVMLFFWSDSARTRMSSSKQRACNLARRRGNKHRRPWGREDGTSGSARRAVARPHGSGVDGHDDRGNKGHASDSGRVGERETEIQPCREHNLRKFQPHAYQKLSKRNTARLPESRVEHDWNQCDIHIHLT